MIVTCGYCGRDVRVKRSPRPGARVACWRCGGMRRGYVGSLNKQTAAEIDEEPTAFGDDTMDTRAHKDGGE